MKTYERSTLYAAGVKVDITPTEEEIKSYRTLGKEQFAGQEITMRFIRAPYVESVENDTEILAEHDGKIVAVRQGNQLATAFHPELTEDFTVYEYFFQTIAKRLRK